MFREPKSLSDYVPTPPSNQALPDQEPGGRSGHGRCRMSCNVREKLPLRKARCGLSPEHGKAGAAFHVRSNNGQTGRGHIPWGLATKTRTISEAGALLVRLCGLRPEGFLRTFAGVFAAGSANVTVNAVYEKDSESIALVIRNHGASAEKVSIFDGYSAKRACKCCIRTAALLMSADCKKSSDGMT